MLVPRPDPAEVPEVGSHVVEVPGTRRGVEVVGLVEVGKEFDLVMFRQVGCVRSTEDGMAKRRGAGSGRGPGILEDRRAGRVGRVLTEAIEAQSRVDTLLEVARRKILGLLNPVSADLRLAQGQEAWVLDGIRLVVVGVDQVA